MKCLQNGSIQNPTCCFEILSTRKKEPRAPIKENSEFTQIHNIQSNTSVLLFFQTLDISIENGYHRSLLYKSLQINTSLKCYNTTD
jgi:hypothetical protein